MKRCWPLLIALAILPLVPRVFLARPDPAPPNQTAKLQRPIALHLFNHNKNLLIANRDSGVLAIADTPNGQVRAEKNWARRLSDLACTPQADRILLADEEAGEIILLSRSDLDFKELLRGPVGLSPVSVQMTDDARLATVALLWPRRLAILDLAALPKNPKQPPTLVDLSFAPRLHVLLPGGKTAIVADSFGGKVAVVDVQARKVAHVRDLRFHNIRGLALSRDRQRLLMTHQVLYATGRPSRGDIQAGNMLTNKLTVFHLADLLEPGADLWRRGQTYELGDIERGAGDPAHVAEGPDGQMLVALAGTNEFALGRPEQVIWQRLTVGQRPTAFVVDEPNRRAYVANTFGDSISVIDLKKPQVLSTISLGEKVNLDSAQRGEVLFYNARLAQDAWFSCHSCHTDGHSNGGLNDNFTDKSFGTPKRVLSLLGVKDTAPYAWGGHLESLETQIRGSITSTMQGKKPSDDQVRDLAAYLRTLTPPPALAQARQVESAEAFQRGRKVFVRHKCQTCHTPPSYTSAKAYDVGLKDEAGQDHFNPPSLRGLSQAGPYFHDGRARTLEDVFTRHKHQLTGELSPDELQDLLQFLRNL